MQIGALTIAFDKLGLSPSSALLLLFGSLFGSAINLPLFKIKAERPPITTIPQAIRGLLQKKMPTFNGKTLIAVNVGGCLMPLTFSIYLVSHNPIATHHVLLAIIIVAMICYISSRPIPGLGIGMPIFIAPISAALVAVIIDPHYSPALAYVCGTLGVIIGADLMRLKNIQKMGTPIASIGGAGTFDGIFLTGVVAVLLA
ncbi:MAG: DUF1614 domain-containing protein [Gammaproteobacteria bacterium]